MYTLFCLDWETKPKEGQGAVYSIPFVGHWYEVYKKILHLTPFLGPFLAYSPFVVFNANLDLEQLKLV
jgi:hypothetical protein